MEEHQRQRRLVSSTAQATVLLVIIYLFYAQSSAFDITIVDRINLRYGKQNLSNLNAANLRPRKFGVVEDNLRSSKSLKSLFKGLVKGDDRRKLETTSFACDSTFYSLVCVASNNVKIHTETMEVHLPTHDTNLPPEGDETVVEVRPYAGRQLQDLMKLVTPVKFVHENKNNTSNIPTQISPCKYNHNMPAIIFSSSGFSGNLFHEFNEIIIPLFITSRHFQSRLQFILVDYRPSFIEKYSHILSRLSAYEILNPKVNTSVHCFPGAVVGLKFHNFLAINSTEVPQGHSMQEFKKFLRKTYNLRIKNVSEMRLNRRPVLILISRQKTRIFLNEDEMVELMEEQGFQVVVVKSDKNMSNLSRFAKLMNTASVLVGTHGAGLTNQVFLPAGAVVVQVVPLGLEWPSTVYFGGPAAGMGLRYLEYKIEREESSLINSYGRDDPVMVDPGSVFGKGYEVGRAVYLVKQNVRISVDRFRGTLVEALKLLERTTPSSGG